MKDWLKLWVSMRFDPDWILASPVAAKVWVHLLLAARMARDGEIPDPKKVAFELRLELPAVEAAYAELSAGKDAWLRLDGDQWRIPRFTEWQRDDEEREKWREKKRQQREGGKRPPKSKMSPDVPGDNECPPVSPDVPNVPPEKERRKRGEREEKDTLEPSHAPGHTRGIPPPPAAWVPGFWLQGTQKLDLNGSWAMDQAVKRAMDRYGDNEGEATLRVRHILGIEREAEGLAALAQILEADGQKQMARILVLSEEVEKSRKGKRR